jgi:hypothetical protein
MGQIADRKSEHEDLGHMKPEAAPDRTLARFVASEKPCVGT